MYKTSSVIFLWKYDAFVAKRFLNMVRCYDVPRTGYRVSFIILLNCTVSSNVYILSQYIHLNVFFGNELVATFR